MRRWIEWILALGGAAICTLDAAIFWKYIPGPGTQHWPLSAFPLIEIVALGWIAAAGLGLDNRPRNTIFSALAWFITGCLSPYFLLAFFSFGPLLVLADALFIAAGLLANRRLKRDSLPDITFFSIGAVANLVVILNVIKAVGGI
jgi:hypothetical protein